MQSIELIRDNLKKTTTGTCIGAIWLMRGGPPDSNECGCREGVRARAPKDWSFTYALPISCLTTCVAGG